MNIVHADRRERFHTMVVRQVYDQLQGAVARLRQDLHVGGHIPPVRYVAAVRVAVYRLDLAVIGGRVELTAQHRPRNCGYLRLDQRCYPMAQEPLRGVGPFESQFMGVVVKDYAPRPPGSLNPGPFLGRPIVLRCSIRHLFLPPRNGISAFVSVAFVFDTNKKGK